MDKKQYSHMITFQLTKKEDTMNRFWHITLETLDKTPTINEWNEFTKLHKEKLGDNWIILNQLTIKL